MKNVDSQAPIHPYIVRGSGAGGSVGGEGSVILENLYF